MNQRKYHIAILSAMPEEVGEFVKYLEQISETVFGDLTIYNGILKNNKTVEITLAWSGWGKVSAARALTRVIGISKSIIPIDLIIFTGVAGAIDFKLSQWDIVVSKEILQHDMDASPLFKKYVIPSLEIDRIQCKKSIYQWAEEKLKKAKDIGIIEEYGNIISGLIGTGDRFISDEISSENLKKDIPDLLAVEMEGGSVAQVAEQERIPWLILRVISDSSDNSADISFKTFIDTYKHVSWKLLDVLLKSLDNAPI